MKRTFLFFLALSLMTQAQLTAQNAEAPAPSSAPDQLQQDIASPTPVNVQPLVIHGRIVDAESGQPLAFATIGLKKLGIGTASNEDGDWSLKIPQEGLDGKLKFSYLGYVPQELSISDLATNPIIRLAPSGRQLADIVVMPKDFIGELLRKAYKAIPENYPTGPTLCDGFYRETQRVNDTLFLYFDEAVLNVYKNTYRNAKNFGQIRVEKSRKNVFPGIDSINDVRFYGGPHFPNDLDIVFSRWDFIKPSEYKNWAYELDAMYKDSLSDIYAIKFKNRKTPNSSFQGRIFIDSNSSAYVGFELKRAGLSVFSNNGAAPDLSYIPGNTTIKIGYTEKDGKYNLGYITYKTSGVNTISKTRVYKEIEYVTTSVKTDSVSPIPFNQQFDYTDILSIEADDYTKSYWKDYNVLQENNALSTQTDLLYQKEQAMAQLTKVYNRELTEQEKALLFLKRFTFDGGFSYHPIHYLGGQHHLAYGSAVAVAKVASNYFGIATMDGIRFELTKRLSIFSTLSAALYGIEQIQYDLGLSYRTSLAPSGRWVFLDLGLAASTSTTKIDLCSLTNPNGIQINGKTFNSKTIDVKAGKSGYGIRPVVGLAVRMGKRYELFADGSYFLPLLFKREYVQFKETEGFFLSRKSAKVHWDNPNMLFEVDNERITSPRFEVEPYQFRLGIRSGF